MHSSEVSLTPDRFSGGINIRPTIPGIWAGLFAVALFAMTAPASKLALNYYSAEMIASSRALLAGIGALMLILIKTQRGNWSLPNRSQFGWLALAGLGVVVGFPYLLTLNLNTLSASQMGIVLAGLPLVTTVLASLLFGERHAKGFWLSAMVGCALLLLFFSFGNGNTESQQNWSFSTGLILIVQLLLGGLGYSCGAHVARSLGGWQTICWTLVLYLPISAIVFGYTAGIEAKQIRTEDFYLLATTAILYLALFSQWLGFKYWYQALAESGTGRISQIQLLQPFITMFVAVLFLGEAFQWSYLIFAGLIAITVFVALRFKITEKA